jgi:hypothetical protein
MSVILSFLCDKKRAKRDVLLDFKERLYQNRGRERYNGLPLH